MTTFTWTSGSGDWAGAGTWSPAGGPPDATTDSAILTGGTAPYTVTIAPGETFTAAGVTLDDPLATLDINGGLALASGNIGVDAGTLLLDQSGTISGGTITPAGGTILFDGGTLAATTWNGVLDLGAGNATLEITGFVDGFVAQSLSVTSPDGSPGTIELSGDGARLDLLDYQTLDGLTIDIGSTGAAGATLRAAESGGPATQGLGANSTLGTNTVLRQTIPGSHAIIASQFSTYPYPDVIVDNGTIDAEAPGGTLEVTGELFVAGTLNVRNGETLLVDGTVPGFSGVFMSDADPVLNVDATSSVIVSSGTLNLQNTTSIAPGGQFVVESGAISLSDGVVNGSMTVDGTLEEYGSDLTINGNIIGSGTLDAALRGTLLVNGSVAGLHLRFGPLGGEFGGAAATVIDLDQPNSVTTPIQGFADGAELVLQGFSLTGTSLTADTLTLDNAAGSVTIDLAHPIFSPFEALAITDDPATGDTTVSQSLNQILECFAHGTRIATPRGEVPVQTLRPGDEVTVVSGKAVKVKWIGHRRISCRAHPVPKKVWPVRVCAGAFGPRLPRHDLWLSPNHAVFVDDVLIPIKHLINHTTIAQVPVDDITYYHIELPRHDVVLAEGLPAESYLDTGDRSNFANADGPIRLFANFSTRAPDFAAMWEAYGFARLIVTGPELDAVRQRVNARSGKTRRRTRGSRRA